MRKKGVRTLLLLAAVCSRARKSRCRAQTAVVATLAALIANPSQVHATELIVDHPREFEIVSEDGPRTMNLRGSVSRADSDEKSVTILLIPECAPATCGYSIWEAEIGANNTWNQLIRIPTGRSRIQFRYGSGPCSRSDHCVTVTVLSGVSVPKYSGETRVSVSWEADWEIIIAAIARETLSGGALAPNHDASFPRKVRNRVMELIKSAFADTRIRISDISPHVSLEFLTTEGTSFGRIGSVGCGYGSSPGAVNLGYFKKSMTDHLDDWVPMNLSDSSDLRAEDIAFALADTAIHEISHSLGLVVCDWMGDDYSDHGHNPPSSLDLFGYGGYRMDSGGRVKKYRRLGYENASQHRTAVRILRSLNSLNASYIGKVYGDD